jgi:hypothetical protein
VLYPGDGGGKFLRPRRIDHGWHVMNDLIGPGEFNTDWGNDLLARKASDGSLCSTRARAAAGSRRPPSLGMAGTPSTDHRGERRRPDGWVDRVARQPSGSMYLYPGNGVGRFRTPTKIGTGWAEFDLLI